MSREWKPGDVGLSVEWGYRGIYVGSCDIAEHGRGGRACWHNESGFADPATDKRRTLVVIDPEDVVQVARFIDACAFPPQSWQARDVRAALREFANPTPPKPEEPTGLGAVVEDTTGGLWVRLNHEAATSDPWKPYGSRSHRCAWEKVPAVRVLSEGFQP